MYLRWNVQGMVLCNEFTRIFYIPFEEYRVIKVRIVLVKVIMNFKLTFFFCSSVTALQKPPGKWVAKNWKKVGDSTLKKLYQIKSITLKTLWHPWKRNKSGIRPPRSRRNIYQHPFKCLVVISRGHLWLTDVWWTHVSCGRKFCFKLKIVT